MSAVFCDAQGECRELGGYAALVGSGGLRNY